jgi:hypothetical protein
MPDTPARSWRPPRAGTCSSNRPRTPTSSSCQRRSPAHTAAPRGPGGRTPPPLPRKRQRRRHRGGRRCWRGTRSTPQERSRRRTRPPRTANTLIFVSVRTNKRHHHHRAPGFRLVRPRSARGAVFARLCEPRAADAFLPHADGTRAFAFVCTANRGGRAHSWASHAIFCCCVFKLSIFA